MTDLVTDTGATFSECGTYRYDLWRIWNGAKTSLTFVMLNPSTADNMDNDPTVERCQRRAMKLGFGGLRIVNLMSYRSTNPEVLIPLERHVSFGPENRKYLTDTLTTSGQVICGWGKYGHMGPVAWFTTQARRAEVPLYALKINKDGSPQHPLYIPYSKQPVWWAGADEVKP